jgi:hypothetical protein
VVSGVVRFYTKSGREWVVKEGERKENAFQSLHFVLGPDEPPSNSPSIHYITLPQSFSLLFNFFADSFQRDMEAQRIEL